MGADPIRRPASAETDVWTWIILAGLLVLGVVVGLGGLAITSLNQQGQVATGAQTTPGAR